MTLYIGDKLIAGKPDGVLNNPFSLLDSKYSDHKLNNLSWLLSNNQMNSGTVYVDAYNLLLKLYNGTETIEGITVKALGDSTITDYDFVIDTANTQFRLPLLNGSEDLPSDKYEDLPIQATGSFYTAPANGYIQANGQGTTQGGRIYLYSPDNQLNNTCIAVSNGSLLRTFIPCKKGDIIRFDYNDTTSTRIRFIYAQGNGNLYYYVGETVQNTNLIDAGRIEETLATKEDIDTWVYYKHGTSGYRYNRRNGYCEQWGITNATSAGTTINLVKTFADTNYNGFAQNAVNTYRSDSYASEISVIPNTGSNFKLYSGVAAGVNSRWKVWGYLAQGQY